MASHRSLKIQQLATTFEPPGMISEQQSRSREPKRMLEPPKEPKTRQPKKIRSPRNQEQRGKVTQTKDRSASIISKSEKVMEVAPNSPEYQIQFVKNSKKNTVESLPRLELRELLNSDEAQQINQGRKKKKKKSRQKNEKAEKIEKTEKISEKTPSRDPEEEEDEDEEELEEEEDDEEGYSSGEEHESGENQNFEKGPIKKRVRIKKEKNPQKLEFENQELIRELKKKDEIIKNQEKSKEDMTTEIYELKLEIQRLKFKLRNVKVESKIKIARSSIRMDESAKNSLKEDIKSGKRVTKVAVDKEKRNSRNHTQNIKRNSKKMENQIIVPENDGEAFVLRKKRSPRDSDENKKKSLEPPAGEHEKGKKSPRENENQRSKSEPRENEDNRKKSLEKALERTLENEENRKNSLEKSLEKTLEQAERKKTAENQENDGLREETRTPGGSKIIAEEIEVENEKLKEEVLRLKSKNADSLGVIAEYEEIVKNQIEEIKELKGQLIKILELDESLQSQIAEERAAHLKTQEELNKLKSKYKVQDTEVSSPRKDPSSQFAGSQGQNVSFQYVSTAPYDHKKQLKIEKKKRRNFLRFGRSTSKLENVVHPREDRPEIPQMNSLGSHANALAAPPKRLEVDAGPDSRFPNNRATTAVDPQPIAMTPEQMRKELEVLVLLGEKLQDELTSEKKSHQQTKQKLEQVLGILEQRNHAITPANSYEENHSTTPR